jgi:hypothetical protein
VVRRPARATPKVLRRTYACRDLILSELRGGGHGLDLRSLQEAMGHESLETTALYLSDVSSYLNRMRRPVSLVEAAASLVGAARRLTAGRSGDPGGAALRGARSPSSLHERTQRAHRPAELGRVGPTSREARAPDGPAAFDVRELGSRSGLGPLGLRW